MPLVICVVLFLLEKQLGALGNRCYSAEQATKRKFLQFKVPVNFFNRSEFTSNIFEISSFWSSPAMARYDTAAVNLEETSFEILMIHA